MNGKSLKQLPILMAIFCFTGICCLLFYCFCNSPPRAEGALIDEHGWMTAHIRLEGRYDHSGVVVSVDGWQQVT